MLVAAERKVYETPAEVNRPVKTIRLHNPKVGKKPWVLFMVVVAADFTFGLYYTSLSAAIASKGYQLERIRSEVRHLETATERLEYTMAAMSSLEKVEKVAVEQLGMSKPDYHQVVYVEERAKTEYKDGMLAEGQTGIEVPGEEDILLTQKLYAFVSSIFAPRKAEASSI